MQYNPLNYQVALDNKQYVPSSANDQPQDMPNYYAYTAAMPPCPISDADDDETVESASKFNVKKSKRKQVKNACVNCQKACKKCDEGRPCQRCIKLGITATCINSPRKERKKGVKRGPYKKRQRHQRQASGSDSPQSIESLSMQDHATVAAEKEIPQQHWLFEEQASYAPVETHGLMMTRDTFASPSVADELSPHYGDYTHPSSVLMMTPPSQSPLSFSDQSDVYAFGGVSPTSSSPSSVFFPSTILDNPTMPVMDTIPSSVPLQMGWMPSEPVFSANHSYTRIPPVPTFEYSQPIWTDDYGLPYKQEMMPMDESAAFIPVLSQPIYRQPSPQPISAHFVKQQQQPALMSTKEYPYQFSKQPVSSDLLSHIDAWQSAALYHI
ncbi:uncharacterized protein BYT42DRAFT_566874 [Radiomyces spectabilis]|uniref:uncharacterized protein n=1 Tax=Radiomyces spectabilis TaxID=64574 RepID=UPI00221FC54B|nr:uncharacterized protein BYT42DRAFT_566874 [Radiomyces spectabilis]KAI8381539.1 hypothetical protein BYT42DRAFT_566874 [Radiomyces spectabilis]